MRDGVPMREWHLFQCEVIRSGRSEFDCTCADVGGPHDTVRFRICPICQHLERETDGHECRPRPRTLLAYGDTFAEIASLLDVPIAGMPPEEAGPRLAAAVERLKARDCQRSRDAKAMALLRRRLTSLRLVLYRGEPDGWQVGDGPVTNDPAEAVLAAFGEKGD